MPTETPAQYRARVASNAAKTGAQMPVQKRSSIPSPAQKPMTLPKMRELPKPPVTRTVPYLGNSADVRPSAPSKPLAQASWTTRPIPKG